MATDNVPFEYVHYQSLFGEYGMSPEAVGELMWRWKEGHRYYHNEAHLSFLVNAIEDLFARQEITARERKILLMTAFFHDIIYDPTAFDNEEKSAALFSELCDTRPDSSTIKQLILETKTHEPSTELSEKFIQLDLAILNRSSISQLLAYEASIRKEYQFADYSIYKMLRTNFISQYMEKHPDNSANLEVLLQYLENYRPSVGIYAGSFNPFHNGHLNILEKAEKVFEKVIIVRGINPEKQGNGISNFPNTQVLKYRQTEDFTGLLTDYIASKEAHSQVTLIRGLRNGDDLDYEVNQLRFMEDMKPDIKVVFIRCDKQFEHISSSAIRNLEKIAIGLGKKYLPAE
jgi:pantetheine-phosphate adenylyltransferase